MQALQLIQPKQFRLIELPEPPEPAEGEAVVRVHRAGVCGTDLSSYLGKMPSFTYPRIPGHELGVEVAAVGAGVTHVSVGDRCSVEPYFNDVGSFASRRGRGNCCEQLTVLGVHIDGGLRRHFTLPARKLHRSTSLDWEQLALVETLAVGCHAVDRAGPLPGEHALVIGAGPIGLSVVQFLKLAHAHVTVLDVNAGRLDFCRRAMKADETIQLVGDDSELHRLQEITSGHLPTVVIDATGNAQSMSKAFQYVGHTGRLVYVGITSENVSFAHPLMHRREMTVLASRNAMPDDFTRIIALMELGEIESTPWITHRTSFAETPVVFPSFAKSETGVVKAMIDLDG